MGLISGPKLSRSEQQAVNWRNRKSTDWEKFGIRDVRKESARAEYARKHSGVTEIREESNFEKVNRYAKPVLKKAESAVSHIARNEKKVVRYATSSPKVRHSRNLNWRL